MCAVPSLLATFLGWVELMIPGQEPLSVSKRQGGDTFWLAKLLAHSPSEVDSENPEAQEGRGACVLKSPWFLKVCQKSLQNTSNQTHKTLQWHHMGGPQAQEEHSSSCSWPSTSHCVHKRVWSHNAPLVGAPVSETTHAPEQEVQKHGASLLAGFQ